MHIMNPFQTIPESEIQFFKEKSPKMDTYRQSNSWIISSRFTA